MNANREQHSLPGVNGVISFGAIQSPGIWRLDGDCLLVLNLLGPLNNHELIQLRRYIAQPAPIRLKLPDHEEEIVSIVGFDLPQRTLYLSSENGRLGRRVSG